MALLVRDGGVWKPTVGKPWVKDAGVWKQASGYVKDAGVWKPFTSTPLGIYASNSGISAAASTHTISLPSGIGSGDLLFLLFGTRDTRTFTPPAGWTTIATLASGTAVGLSGAYKIADGSEGATTTCSTSGTASRSAHVTLLIRGYQGTPQGVSMSNGQNTAPNPPSISPAWGTSSETLFIAGFVNRATAAPSGIPAGYSGLISAVNPSDPVVALASKIASLASDDPSAFTSGNESWVAGTFAIRSA